MSGLLLLSNENFSVANGIKGKILCNGVKGYSLVLFYSNQCEHCKVLIPIFKKLPETIRNCSFAMINVGQNKEVVTKSKETITPITFVPFIVFYVGGRPYMVYQGPNVMEEIRRFVIEVVGSIEKKQQFSTAPKAKVAQEVVELTDEQLFPFTTGKPICAGGVCYLDTEKAYKG